MHPENKTAHLVSRLNRQTQTEICNLDIPPDLIHESHDNATVEEKRLHFLNRIGELLSTSLEIDEVLKTLAGILVPEFANWCAIDVLREEGNLERVAVMHQNPEMVAYARKFSRSHRSEEQRDGAAIRVVRSGRSELYPRVSDDTLLRFSHNAEHLELLKVLGIRSAMVVPLISRNTAQGVLTLVATHEGCYYARNHLVTAEDIGRRAGIVMENARLYETTQHMNRWLEERVRQRTLELEQANRDLESFSYSVSHDLRTPLRAIDGFSRILENEYAPRLDEEGLRLLKIIRDSTAHMGKLIDDLLSYSRLGRRSLIPGRFDPGPIVRELTDMLSSADPERNIQLSIGDLPDAWADPNIVRTVFQNLLSNAYKFTRGRDPARIRVEGAPDGDYIRYQVSDNGTGFDPEYTDKLFSIFQRLHGEEEFEGNGIGLAISRNIVERHGGAIWADGQPDRGASFYFTLPATAEAWVKEDVK